MLWILSAGFRFVGPSAALPTDFFRDGSNNFAGGQAALYVCCYTDDDGSFAVQNGPQDNDTGFQFVAQGVHQSSHLVAVQSLGFLNQNFDSLNIFCLN